MQYAQFASSTSVYFVFIYIVSTFVIIYETPFEVFAVLGCYSAYVGSWFDFRRFGTARRPHLQGSSSPWSMDVGPMGCPETSLILFNAAPREVVEDRRRHSHSKIPSVCVSHIGNRGFVHVP